MAKRKSDGRYATKSGRRLLRVPPQEGRQRWNVNPWCNHDVLLRIHNIGMGPGDLSSAYVRIAVHQPPLVSVDVINAQKVPCLMRQRFTHISASPILKQAVTSSQLRNRVFVATLAGLLQGPHKEDVEIRCGIAEGSYGSPLITASRRTR